MYRLLPLMGDAGLGILVYLGVGYFYGSPDAWGLLLAPCIFLPDIDSLAQVRKKGYAAASGEDPVDHREFLHKPVFWLLPALFAWIAFGYYGALLFFLFLAHFLHDSVLTGWGVPWLAPWSKVRLKFFADEANNESLRFNNWVRIWTPENLQEKIRAFGNEDWIRDLYLRLSIPSTIEYSVFILAVILLFWSLFTSV